MHVHVQVFYSVLYNCVLPESSRWPSFRPGIWQRLSVCLGPEQLNPYGSTKMYMLSKLLLWRHTCVCACMCSMFDVHLSKPVVLLKLYIYMYINTQAPRLSAQYAFVRFLGNVCRKMIKHTSRELRSEWKVVHGHSANGVLYSEKVLLVQVFAKMTPGPPEKNLWLSFFLAACWSDHNPTHLVPTLFHCS